MAQGKKATRLNSLPLEFFSFFLFFYTQSPLSFLISITTSLKRLIHTTYSLMILFSKQHVKGKQGLLTKGYIATGLLGDYSWFSRIKDTYKAQIG